MKCYVFVLFAYFTLVCGLGTTWAADQPVDLNVGDSAPDFSGAADDDSEFKSTDVVGQKILVVYFYPADMTSGCTKQACSYRDSMQSFRDHDVRGARR
ncbi:redoxin domain-containing protein [Bythopirellula goksoeyrii]|uniref:redoxin domain-containing protein n=1 Tax=Bythopirellula goksoeyrii TaxID=1400387 RepID=UPI00143D7A11|nr:redoxin domain-containing protein [Bythopirellula goksoeyrii]